MTRQVCAIAGLLAGLLWSADLSARQRPGRDASDALVHKASALLQAGKPDEARKLFQSALTNSEQTFGKEHLKTAVAALGLGRAYADLGDLARAESLYLRSLAVHERQLGKDHPHLTVCLNNLGSLYMDLGEYAKAEPLYRRSLKIREATSGKDHPDVAVELSNLASLYKGLGEYARAEPLYRRALQIRETKLGKKDLLVAVSLSDLAALHHDMGQYARAAALSRRGLEITRAARGNDHPDVATALNNLAAIHKAQGEFDKAEALFRDSVRIFEARSGKNHPDVAVPLSGLAGVHRARGDYARAEALFRRCLEIREARLGKGHHLVGSSLTALAAVYEQTGRMTTAVTLARRALRIRETKLGASHPDVADTLGTLAVLRHRQGDTAEAARLLDRARHVSRRHVSLVLPSLPPAEQAAFLAASERGNFAGALSLGLARSKDANVAALCATWLLNGKAVAEEALAQSALQARDRRDPAKAERAASLHAVRARLARLSVAPPPADESAHRQKLQELAEQEEDLSRQLAAAGGASATAAPWLELRELRKALPAGAAFIDVARFGVFDFGAAPDKRRKPARYVAWVTRAEGDVRVVDLGEAAAIDEAVAAVRRALEQSAGVIRQRGEPAAEKELRGPLEALSNLVLRPLLPHAGQSSEWVVSPDGNLWLVPWEILLLADGKYAVEQHALRYVVSGRDLVARPGREAKAGAPLVVADPDFDLDARPARLSPVRAGEPTRGLSSLLRLGRVKRLPGTLVEAKAIRPSLQLYAKQSPKQLLGREALEGAVKAVANPRVLVLSTHGFFVPAKQGEPAQSPLLRCGLLLAGCNERAKAADGDDGVLTGLEVVGMDLRGCEMVVLSACETGLGDVQNGEGVAGLRQAFRLAGAESVVSTLWQVPDRASARLMTRFFQNLAAGKDRAAALREARLSLIKDQREDAGAAHPFFWAAFTLTGGA
jgi:CHAT domain-containing protein/Tfp pilus assembly protein PilF